MLADQRLERHRYLPSYAAPYLNLQSEGNDHASSQPAKAYSSADRALNAFAQLAALRLRTRRAMISLIDRNSQFVLAEATQTLSSQSDDVHDEGDSLWMGVRTIPREDSLCSEIIGRPRSRDERTSQEGLTIVPRIIHDLEQDETTKDKSYVQAGPKIRFYAGVPIVTRQGHFIGSYCVLDDRPRLDISKEELTFLKDMSETIMEHLENIAVRGDHQRGEKMVKGLGLFVEGHSSITHWWLHTRGQRLPVPPTNSQSPSMLESPCKDEDAVISADTSILVDGLADSTAPESEVKNSIQQQLIPPPNVHAVSPADGPQDIHSQHSPSEDSHFQDELYEHDSKSSSRISSSPASPPRDKPPEDSPTHDDGPPRHDASQNVSQQDVPLRTAAAFKSSVVSGSPTKMACADDRNLPDIAVTIKTMLSRASNLIRESTEVDGVIFFDAKHGGFGFRGDRPSAAGSKTNGNEEPNNTTSSSEEGWGNSTHSYSSGSASDRSRLPKPGPEPRTCDVLAYSSREASSLNDNNMPANLTISEAFVSKLFKRYPHGKIFAFDRDGAMSSSEDEIQQATAGKGVLVVKPNNQHRKNTQRAAEGETILKIFPGSRFVLLLPLWDSHRERWFASAILWTNDPTRVLSIQDDLSYVAAFGNSIMAEVSRLDAVAADHTKSTLISSISHELRSPLHGVLGSLELLQDTVITEYQTSVIDTIRHCSTTLLDTLNNVLDYAKINNFTRARRSEKRLVRTSARSGKAIPSEGLRIYGTISLTSDLDLASMTEDVLGGLYTGHDYINRPQGNVDSTNLDHHSMIRDHGAHRPHYSPLVVVFDVDPKRNWRFSTQPGAWKRILMNIYGNALKYTTSGYVRVRLGYRTFTSPGLRINQGIVTLTITDTGKGISQEFLNDQLYTPFTQEDTLSEGAGLGLSIVRQIVTALDGKLEINSIKGSGTTVTVMLKLKKSHNHSTSTAQIQDEIQRARVLAKDHVLAIAGFPRSNDFSDSISQPEITPGPLSVLRHSIWNIAQAWLNMEVTETSDFSSEKATVFVTTSKIFEERKLEWFSQTTSSSISKKYIIVLTASTASENKTRDGKHQHVYYLGNPIGPKKFARCLISILDESSEMAEKTSSDAPYTPAMSASVDAESLALKTELTSRPQILNRSNSAPFQSASIDPTPTGARSSSHTDGPSILLVEDNMINMRILVTCIAKLRYTYSTAENGAKAVEQYERAERKPDIIFMDMSMPIMNGFDATKCIRSYERENKLPAAIIVAVTGLASEESQREAYNSGINLFLSKPVPLRDLRKIVENWEDIGRN
ncbi:hypothetical protein BP6252_03815 [Coleophoma cylindrospora]|uniref:Uncharacterized protein n=1 Tax=Coleophoma cylindrospora TaxID=1849047 RepID=A0A3D8S8S9_9HELO|nr:hypothetical protein BP6252_03815 [Coleophoma cylindrospora]